MDRERYVLFDGFSRGKHIIEQIHLFNYIKKRWREGFQFRTGWNMYNT